MENRSHGKSDGNRGEMGLERPGQEEFTAREKHAFTPSAARRFLAVAIGVLPVHAGLLWHRLSGGDVFTVAEMLAYPLGVGGANILLILLLDRFLLKAPRRGFSPGAGTVPGDLGWGIVLLAAYFLLMAVERALLGAWLPGGKPLSPELLNLLRGLVRDPLLLALWLGPVLWVGVALFEETARVFTLKTLWGIRDSAAWRGGVILAFAALFGLAHLYQGWIGVVSTGVQAVVSGLFYLRFRRLGPLVWAHGLFDGIQVAQLVILLRS